MEKKRRCHVQFGSYVFTLTMDTFSYMSEMITHPIRANGTHRRIFHWDYRVGEGPISQQPSSAKNTLNFSNFLSSGYSPRRKLSTASPSPSAMAAYSHVLLEKENFSHLSPQTVEQMVQVSALAPQENFKRRVPTTTTTKCPSFHYR